MRVALCLAVVVSLSGVSAAQVSSLNRMADALEGIQRDASSRDIKEKINREIERSNAEMQMMDLASRAQYCYQLAMTMGQRASMYKDQVDTLTQKLKKAEQEIKDLQRDAKSTDMAVNKAIKNADGDALARYLKEIFRSTSRPNTPIPEIEVKVK